MKLWNFEVWESPPKRASIFNIQPAVKYEVKASCPNSTASTPKVQSAPYQRWPCGQCPGYPGWMPAAKRSIFLFCQGAWQAASVHLAPQMAANTPCQPWCKWRPWGGKGLLDKSCTRQCSVFRIHLFGYLFVFSSCIVFTISKHKKSAPPHCLRNALWPFLTVSGTSEKLQSLQYQPKNIKKCRSSIKYQSLAVCIN